jgi:hypothetical protein
VPGGKWIGYTAAQVIARRAARVGMRLVCAGGPVMGAFVPAPAWAPPPTFYGPPAAFAPAGDYWPGIGEGGYGGGAPYFPGASFGGGYGGSGFGGGYTPVGFIPGNGGGRNIWHAKPPFGPDDLICPPTDVVVPGTPGTPGTPPVVDVPSTPSTPVPEPSSLLVVALGFGLVWWNRRRA